MFFLFETLLNNEFFEALVIIVKAGISILLLLHLVFSLILIKQTNVMNKVVEVNISPTIYAISIIHFLASLFVLLWLLVFF